MICTKCGGLITEPGKLYGWGGSFCHCPSQTITLGGGGGVGRWYDPKEHCNDHCYCQEETIGTIVHKKCCMCGHRKTISPNPV